MKQAFQSDSSDGKFSDNEEYEAVNAAEAVAKLEAESFDTEGEEIVSVLPRPFGFEKNMGQSHDENQSADSTDSNAPQPIRSKHGSFWMMATTSQCVQCRQQQQNIIHFRSGPTSYAAHRIPHNSVVSSFIILFNEPMLRHIRKCIITESQRVTGNDKWSVSLDELDKFIGLVVARGVIGSRTLPIKSM